MARLQDTLTLVKLRVLFGQIVNEIFGVQRFAQLVRQQSIQAGVATPVAVHLVGQPRLDG